MSFSTYGNWYYAGMVFAVGISGVVSILGWIVARQKQRKLEALEKELEEAADEGLSKGR